MDTTVKLNLLLIVLVGAICGFIIKEMLGGPKFQDETYEETAGYSAASAVARKFAQKTYGLAGFATQPDDAGADTPLSLDGGAPAATEAGQQPAPSPIIAESRIFIAQPDDGVPVAGTADGAAQTPPSAQKNTWPPLPQGFTSALTNDYMVYREQLPVGKNLQKYLENIHGNFVLDVLPFSAFSDFKRIFLMMFRSRDKYSGFTEMPQWSAATTDIQKGAVYIMESKSFKSDFVHELSHIYYDGFFKPVLCPLWLSEGFAVRMQTAAQTPAERTWYDSELARFQDGRYIKFGEFTGVKDLSSYGGDDVITWYAQAYSVVDYLLKNKTRDEFYQFSKNLKDGQPLERALYRAYGMPFNNINALEYAWQDYLQRYVPRKLQDAGAGPQQ
ncbi:MAG: hypothetical protein LBL61_02235 [Elusimicrobiota bacterium]|jgi:hypothetical protein|nr:hypothetical protein [Elusimicrobiota bacterium]